MFILLSFYIFNKCILLPKILVARCLSISQCVWDLRKEICVILPGLQGAPPHTHMWMVGSCVDAVPRMVKELVAGYYKLRKHGIRDGES